jgi:hypothetical protein
MAWRFRQSFIDTSDILDPFHWNRNHQEFASEVNGYLDRDNFRNQIFDFQQIVDESCNQLFEDYIGTFFEPDMTTTAWQGGSAIAPRSFRTTSDGLAIVEYNGYHQWTDDETSGDELCLRYKLVLDGSILYRTGWFSIHRKRDSPYMVGALPIPPGPHLAEVEIQIGNVRTSGEEPDRIDPLSADVPQTVELGDREILVHMRYR